MIPSNTKFYRCLLCITFVLGFTACQAVEPVTPIAFPEVTETYMVPSNRNENQQPVPNHLPTAESISVDSVPTITENYTQPDNPVPTGLVYLAQSGDTLQTISRRFGLEIEEIILSTSISEQRFLYPGEIVLLPDYVGGVSGKSWLIPDSEVVYGPSAQGFSIEGFLYQSRGSLRHYQEWLKSSGWSSAAQIIERVALENSINPRLLVSLLEWECGCVTGSSTDALDSGYVLGVNDFRRKSLYGQLSWAARTLAEGYYGWRSGVLDLQGESGVDFVPDDFSNYLPADSNAGTAALVVLFSRLMESRTTGDQVFSQSDWYKALDSREGFAALHERLLGDPWERDRQAGDLLPANLTQPEMLLPFEKGWIWSFTSGPHPAWENSGALSALDFAPATAKTGCDPSPKLVLAVADGVVVRSDNGIVIQDLDNPEGTLADGYEGSGWAILYMHVHHEGRVQAGTRLQAGDPIGHPSCEGGPATGTHLHIARKYNGEWMAADGPVPFVLEGWTAHNGAVPYEGSLTKGDQTITANVFGPRTSWIQRPNEEYPTPRVDPSP